jgi:hypothetical protein
MNGRAKGEKPKNGKPQNKLGLESKQQSEMEMKLKSPTVMSLC